MKGADDRKIDSLISSKPMKILFVSHEYRALGSTISMISLIRGLNELYPYLEVEVIIPFAIYGKARKLLIKNHIKYKELLYRNNFFVINNRHIVKEQLCDIVNKAVVGLLARYIKKKEISIVCSNSSAVDVGARAAMMANTPHIYYVREFMEEDHGLSYRNKERMKRLLEHAEGTIFISKAIEKKYISQFCFRNARQFFNGFAIEDYYIDKHNILNSKELSIVQVGKLCDGKGTCDTIRLLYDIIENGIINWNMEFIGICEKDYLLSVKSLIEKCHLSHKIIISNYCENIKEKLAGKDILIMNSKAEGFGRVTVEGMLAGCLVIGRRGYGTDEIITDGVNGMIFGSSEEFVYIIRNILKDRAHYKKIAAAGQLIAVNKFDYKNTAKEFMKVIEECVER